MVESFENSGHRVFQGESWALGILKKRIEKPFTSIENMAILTCCTGLFMPRSTGQFSKWCGPNSGDAAAGAVAAAAILRQYI